jgi:hypothetical protein
MPMYRRLKLNLYLSPCTKSESKTITWHLKVWNIRKPPEDAGIRNNFLNRIPIVQQIRTRIDKWHCTKLKSCTAKKTVTRMNRQFRGWENIFANHTFHKGLTTRIYKELKNLNSQRTNNPIKIMGKWIEHTIHLKYKWPTNTWKNVQHPQPLRKYKTILILHLTLVKIP